MFPASPPGYIFKFAINFSHLATDKENQWFHCTKNGCYLPHSCCISNQLKCSPLILLQNYTKNEEVGKQRAKEWFYFTGEILLNIQIRK